MMRLGCNCTDIVQANNLTNLSCERFPWVHNWWTQVIYIFMFGLIIAMSIGGNLIVIWIVLAHRRMRTVTNYFLLNLAIADASISLFNVCFSFTFNLYYKWFFGSHYCVFNNFMGVAPTCASVFTLMSMSLERYVAIVHPLRQRLSRKKTIAAIFLIWLCAGACGLPMLLCSYTYELFFFEDGHAVKDVICLSTGAVEYVAIVHPLRPRLSRKKTIAAIFLIWLCAGACGLPMLLCSYTYELFFFEDGHAVKDVICLSDAYPDGTAGTSWLFAVYNNFLLVVTYLLPLFVLSGTFVRVGRELWWTKTIGDYRSEESIQAKRKVVKLMIVVVSIFLVCWLPYHVYFTILMKTLAAMPPLTALYIYLNIYWLAMSSTVFNPIIYCWMNSRFRIGFKYVFRWVPCVRITSSDYVHSELVRDPQKYMLARMQELSGYANRSTYNGRRHELAPNGNLLAETTSALSALIDNVEDRSNNLSTDQV